MSTKGRDLVTRNSIFIWIALAAGLILLIPLIAMQFTSDVSWDETDFIVMGLLIFGAASLFVLIARAVPRKHRAIIGILCVLGFLYIWAELAVGIFTTWGS